MGKALVLLTQIDHSKSAQLPTFYMTMQTRINMVL